MLQHINFKLDGNGINVFYHGFLVYMENSNDVYHRLFKLAEEVRDGKYPKGMMDQMNIANMIMNH